MATLSSLSRQHVLQAIEEYDQRGEDSFLAVYGFAPQGAWSIQHEGRSYDLPAVVGVAHRFATGRIATADDIAGALAIAAGILRKRGFDVTQPGGAPAARTSTRAAAPKAPRAPRAPRAAAAPTTRRAAAPEEKPAPVCPTCFMTLPATGVCDTCG
ncbi:MAG: hypothetical protein J7503_12315 [Cellulomonas iranensis]|uniref:hypothetical protein n=1 Tax=Cellulomonas iranensis TaxID=76862 RepID=UPI001B11EB4C|nr:hypothetical protein [Cellulomonas iranensis]MBO9569596.1 hypothetical protein [Cellulomonas iranensis]